jgi:flagellum-specific ATP synthase
MRNVLATYRKAEDLINIGAYVHGSNPRIDESLSYIDNVNRFLRQGVSERFTFPETVSNIRAVFA